MKIWRIVLISSLFLTFQFFYVNNLFAQVDCNTDEITGNTICKTDENYLKEIEADTRDATFQLSFSKDDKSYFGIINGYASEWQWTRVSTLYILAGDKRYQFDISRNDYEVNRGNTVEQMIVYFSADDIKKIFSTNGDIKIKLADDSYQIKFESFKKEAMDLVETVEMAKKYW
jgi:uncharacterized cupin superfamily protein